LERFKLAEADLERAVAISPQTATAEVYRVLGECYAEENLPTKAIANFSKAIKMNSSEKVPRPQDFRHISTVKTCYLRRAQCYAGLEKYLEAISDANKVVALNPNQSWPYELRARLNKSVGRYENVIEDCTAAIRLAPDSSSNYADRALAYEKLGKHKQAQLDKQKLNDLAEKILGP
jgi:tetratricopeptide (TPR) repeat protein